MVLLARDPAPHQRLVVTASADVTNALTVEAVGAPVEFVIVSRELLNIPGGVPSDWGTTGVYVLAGGPEISLGPGDPITAYDKLLARPASEEPPTEPGLQEVLEEHEHTKHWRPAFTRDCRGT